MHVLCICKCACIYVCSRVPGVQLFHSADEEDESELPQRWSNGCTLCQYEVSYPGDGSHCVRLYVHMYVVPITVGDVFPSDLGLRAL